MKLYFQGDLCLEPVPNTALDGARTVAPALDGAVVLAEGEATGHRHAFYGGAVTLFRDEALARDFAAELYVGHVRIDSEVAELRHEEHDTIALPKGLYRVRRQREYVDRDAIGTLARGRVVVD
jgi:hypothetical protein